MEPDQARRPNGQASRESDKSRSGYSRREVLRTAGAAAALVGLSGASAPGQEAEAPSPWRGPGALALTLSVNGTQRKLSVEARTTLLDALRDRLDLTGSKRVCDRGACGACTVWIDGQPQNACMLLAVEVEGRAVTTIEGLTPKGGGLTPLQASFCQQDALQCGFCTPGMVMSCAALLARTPRPSEHETREAIAGNLCRCGTYPHVLAAVQQVAGGTK